MASEPRTSLHPGFMDPNITLAQVGDCYRVVEEGRLADECYHLETLTAVEACGCDGNPMPVGHAVYRDEDRGYAISAEHCRVLSEVEGRQVAEAREPATGDDGEWAWANTLADLGELTARWLEGAIESHPGYYGRPDDETAELVPILAAANRRGLVTQNSQPGYPPDEDGWEQRAMVACFCEEATAARIREVGEEAGLIVVVTPPGSDAEEDGVCVTRCGATEATIAGRSLPWEEIRFLYGDCPRAVRRALRMAWQVTVADPVWGRQDVVWDALAEALLLPEGQEGATAEGRSDEDGRPRWEVCNYLDGRIYLTVRWEWLARLLSAPAHHGPRWWRRLWPAIDYEEVWS